MSLKLILDDLRKIVGEDFAEASDHPGSCACEKCFDWWVQLGDDENGYGPFDPELIKHYQSKKITPVRDIEFLDDVKRIVGICFEAGYEISEHDAWQIWKDYSESMAAGWMLLDTDDKLVLETILAFGQVNE